MSVPQPELPEQAATTTVRIASLEQRVRDIQQQLSEYERSREIELKLQLFRDQVLQLRADMAEVRKDQAEISVKLVAQELAAQNQANAAKSSQDRLQIKVLVGIVGFIFSVLGGTIIYLVSRLHF